LLSSAAMKEDRRILAEGKYYRFVIDGNWEYIQPACFREVVLIVPVTDDGNLVLVEQYRPPVDARVIEIPAGLVGDIAGMEQEDLLEAAHRELLEETGYQSSMMEVVATGAPSAGSNSLQAAVVLAKGLKKVSDGGGVDSEEIEVHEVPTDRVSQWLDQRRQQGAIIDLKIYVGLYFAGQ